MSIKKALFIALGTLAVFIGSIGIFTPGIPATPLFLLAAYLYSKSSPRLYQLIVNHKVTGKYISSYARKGGMSIRSKVIANIFMMGMVAISAIFFIDIFEIRVLSITLGMTGCLVIIFFVKTVEDDDNI